MTGSHPDPDTLAADLRAARRAAADDVRRLVDAVLCGAADLDAFGRWPMPAKRRPRSRAPPPPCGRG
jgi:hypothetical protein